MPTVLITGCNGLIASKTIELFAQKKWKVVATSHKPCTWQLPANATFELLDITNSAEFSYLAELYAPDVIVNTAAISKPDQCESDPEQCWRTNAESVEYMAAFSAQRNIFFIHFSSDFVFDGTAPYYTEESDPCPLSLYGKSKLASEQAVIEHCNEYAIVRTSMVYGFANGAKQKNFISWVAQSISAQQHIDVVEDQYRTPSYVCDIAKGVLAIAEKKEAGIYNLSGNEFMSVYDFARHIASVFALDDAYIHPTETLLLNEAAKRPMKTYLKIDKATNLLEYIPCSVQEGLLLCKKDF